MRLPGIFEERPAVANRLLKGFGANSLGKVWALLVQLISVPMLTSSWGVEGYGTWLMIATIPVYLGLSDFGLGTAAGIDMTAAISRGDKESASRAFQTVWVFMTFATSFIGLITILAVLAWRHWADHSGNPAFSAFQMTGAVCFITLATLLMVQMAILKTLYQATHKYALGTIILDLASLVEFLVVIISAKSGGSILAATIGMLCVRLIAFYICLKVIARLEPWCKLGWHFADRSTLRRLMRPSLAALTLTLANSFGIQGVVLTIGWAMGPGVAAIFATTRMLTRVPLQFSALLSRASLPELTRAQIAGQTDLTSRLMKINIRLALLAVIPSVFFLWIWGPKIQFKLSHGEMTTDRAAFLILGSGALLNAMWTTYSSRLLAINKQESYSWIVLFAYSACVAAPALTQSNYNMTLLAFAAAEALILVKVFHSIARLNKYK